MLEVLLIFSVNGSPYEVSDKVYESFDECASFVNSLVRKEVVNSDYAFTFQSEDGDLFLGQCISREDLNEQEQRN